MEDMWRMKHETENGHPAWYSERRKFLNQASIRRGCVSARARLFVEVISSSGAQKASTRVPLRGRGGGRQARGTYGIVEQKGRSNNLKCSEVPAMEKQEQ